MENKNIQIGDRVRILSQHSIATEQLGIHYGGHGFKMGDIGIVKYIEVDHILYLIEVNSIEQVLNKSEIQIHSRVTRLSPINNKTKKERLFKILNILNK